MTTNLLAKWLLGIGAFFVISAALVWACGRVGIPLGKLPGDVKVAREKFAVYFPIVTSLVLSLALTVIVNVVLWMFKR